MMCMNCIYTLLEYLTEKLADNEDTHREADFGSHQWIHGL